MNIGLDRLVLLGWSGSCVLTHAIPCDPMRTLLEAVRECPDRSGVVVAFQGNSSLQSLQKSWHRHANTLQRPWCPACTIRQSQTISRIHMEFIHQMISIEIDWWMLMNVDDVDDIWSCNQHTYTDTYWVKVVTYAAVIFLCRKRCAVGKSMIYMSFLLDESIVCGIDFSNTLQGHTCFWDIFFLR